MSRRITKQTPDSLKEAKHKETAVVAVVAEAESQVAKAGEALGEIQKRTTTVAAELKLLEEKYDSERVMLASLCGEIGLKSKELRSVEGELADVISKVAEAETNLQRIISDAIKETERLSKDHQDAMASYAVTQKAAKYSGDEANTALSNAQAQLREVDKRVTSALKEEERLKKDILPQVPKLTGELDNLNHQILVKKVELQNVEEEIVTAIVKTHAEKNMYDQTVALRVTEEARVQAELQKLFDKEGEVEKKMRDLRTIQSGVDQQIKRLERKEEEVELKLHLTKSSTVVTQT